MHCIGRAGMLTNSGLLPFNPPSRLMRRGWSCATFSSFSESESFSTESISKWSGADCAFATAAKACPVPSCEKFRRAEFTASRTESLSLNIISGNTTCAIRPIEPAPTAILLDNSLSTTFSEFGTIVVSMLHLKLLFVPRVLSTNVRVRLSTSNGERWYVPSMYAFSFMGT